LLKSVNIWHKKTLIAIMKLLLILDNNLIWCYIVGHTQIDILLCRKLENSNSVFKAKYCTLYLELSWHAVSGSAKVDGREEPGLSTIDAGVLDYAL